MSGLFSRPKTPDIPPAAAPIEPVQVVQEEAEVARRRERKRLIGRGRAANIIGGLKAALALRTKKRLGE